MHLHIDYDRIDSVRRHARSKQVDLLRRMISRKFGEDAATPDLYKKLLSMNEKDLLALGERLVDADDVQYILDDEPANTPKP